MNRFNGALKNTGERCEGLYRDSEDDKCSVDTRVFV